MVIYLAKGRAVLRMGAPVQDVPMHCYALFVLSYISMVCREEVCSRGDHQQKEENMLEKGNMEEVGNEDNQTK
jgi:hypothetical protein